MRDTERAALGAASFGCFAWAALCYRFFHCTQRDIKSLENAYEITALNLGDLPQRLEAAPKRRLLVRLSGSLEAPVPLKVPEDPAVEVLIVRKRSDSWTVARQPVLLSTFKAQAEDVEIKLRDQQPPHGYAKGPTINLSPNLLDDLQTTDVVSNSQNFEATGLLSTLRRIFFKATWRVTDSVGVVRRGKHVFAAMDAVADSNGRITLIESPLLSNRKYLSYKHFAQVMDDAKDQATVWRSFSASSVLLGSVLAAVAIMHK